MNSYELSYELSHELLLLRTRSPYYAYLNVCYSGIFTVKKENIVIHDCAISNTIHSTPHDAIQSSYPKRKKKKKHAEQ